MGTYLKLTHFDTWGHTSRKPKSQKDKQGYVQDQEYGHRDRELKMLGLVPEDLHGQKASQSPSDKTASQKCRFAYPPLPPLRPALIHGEKYKGPYIDNCIVNNKKLDHINRLSQRSELKELGIPLGPLMALTPYSSRRTSKVKSEGSYLLRSFIFMRAFMERSLLLYS